MSQSPSKTSAAKTNILLTSLPEFPATTISWKDRLCWVHRRSGDRSFFWPALYFVDWAEVSHHCHAEMSIEQKMNIGYKFYHSYGEQAPGAVVKLLGLDTLEIQEVSVQEHGAEKEADFCGEFWAWLPKLSSLQTKLCYFEHEPDWYLPFMKAMDQSMSLVEGETCDKMFRVGKQRLHQWKLDAAASHPHPEQNPIESPPTQSIVADANRHDTMAASHPHPEQNPIESPPTQSTVADANRHDTMAQISPDSDGSPSSCEETPIQTNKAKAKRNEANRQLFVTPNKEKKSPSEKVTTVVSKRAATKSKIQSVTPSRSSSRPKRKPQKDIADTVSLSRLAKTATKGTKEDGFYSFITLIDVLLELQWKYRPATNQLRTWVYERVGTEGEKSGTYLEDYFYEEHEVIDYCRREDYEGKYSHMVRDKNNNEECDPVVTPPDSDENDPVVTPPDSKRMRTEEVSN